VTARRRYALITGAASGLGRALAVRLARDGWHIAVCDLDHEGSRETVTLVEQAGGTAQAEKLDVTVPAEWEALRGRLRDQWELIDLVVNNDRPQPRGTWGTLTDAPPHAEPGAFHTFVAECGLQTALQRQKQTHQARVVASV
jgi:NAD(P)-dependent dehydrogenase (short-subunit alcohol dehydrogenase family)